ncbi:MAG: hypothetical protein SCALA702_28460 [Melioribacteraceae bacterium]|nr:MAG: hypothetical protein SCALA702_28460 [Melioribacteraceae bacterium]
MLITINKGRKIDLVDEIMIKSGVNFCIFTLFIIKRGLMTHLLFHFFLLFFLSYTSLKKLTTSLYKRFSLYNFE